MFALSLLGRTTIFNTFISIFASFLWLILTFAALNIVVSPTESFYEVFLGYFNSVVFVVSVIVTLIRTSLLAIESVRVRRDKEKKLMGLGLEPEGEQS